MKPGRAPGAGRPPAGTPYVGRKARERARRSAEVLAAARRLYGRKGYQRTTMVEVARASELALGTLYQLFPSKEAILRHLLEERVDALLARVHEAAGGSPDVRGQIARIVRTHLAFAQENADVLRLYLSGWIGYDIGARQRFGEGIDTKYRAYLDLLTTVLRRGTRNGLFAPRSPRRLAIVLAGMVHAVIRRWLQEKDLDLLAEGDALLDLFFNGAVHPARTATRAR